MEGVIFGGEPQTPYLYPQDTVEEDEQVPDFFLDDDAGVGSPMDFSDEDYSESTMSLSTILALGEALSPCPSPAPSLISDISLLSEASVMSDSEASDDTFKMKKLVRFLDSVEIVPYSPEAPKLQGPLKPPQEPQQFRMRKLPGSGNGDYSAPENIGILYGLGRAGSPRSSHMKQREFNTRRPTSPPTDHSDSEGEDDSIFGGFKQRSNQYRQQQLLTVPLFPPPSWRATNTPEKPHHDLPPRVRSPGDLEMIGGYPSYEDARYILGQTSPTSPSSPISFPPPFISFSPPPISFSPPLSPPPPPGDGVYRRESNYRNSPEYNSYPFHHPQPQRHSQAINEYGYWKNGEIQYEDQWGRRIHPGGTNTTSCGTNDDDFKLDLWPVKEDAMGEEAISGRRGKVAAVPGGKMTLREQRLRSRGMRGLRR